MLISRFRCRLRVVYAIAGSTRLSQQVQEEKDASALVVVGPLLRLETKNTRRRVYFKGKAVENSDKVSLSRIIAVVDSIAYGNI